MTNVSNYIYILEIFREQNPDIYAIKYSLCMKNGILFLNEYFDEMYI